MTDDQIRALVRDVLSPGCFFLARRHKLRVVHLRREEAAWEIFRGHLLHPSQTRSRRTLESWNVLVEEGGADAGAPLVSVKYAAPEGRIYVTRNILVYGWEAYEDGPGVILSRQATRWTPELVGTIDAAARGPAALGRALQGCLFLAVAGTSRLPITSLESPLASFTLGQLVYLPGPAASPAPSTDPLDLVDRALAADLTSLERAKLLEGALRAAGADDVPRLAGGFVECCRARGAAAEEATSVFRALFDHVALAPYTGFVDNLVSLLLRLAARELLGPAAVIELVGYMLRQLVRHLTAYDLVTFHHGGANYPDALMLDALLKAYLALIECQADEFLPPGDETARASRDAERRRRALRQAWLVRKQYEAHRVPDVPTSAGENLRVLPEPFVRVPEEQISQPASRRKELYAGDPTESLLTEKARPVLRQSIDDLETPAELAELGMALYLDRPLGVFKEPGEVDRTNLVSYEAFSREVARRRLGDLHRWGLVSGPDRLGRLERRLDELPIAGFPVRNLPASERPGVVALEEARKAAGDFLFVRTTRRSLAEFLSHYDFRALKSTAPGVYDWLVSGAAVLVVRTTGSLPAAGEPFLVAYDRQMQPRLELGPGQEPGEPIRYLESGGVEYLADGLQALGVWEPGGGTASGSPRDLRRDQVRLAPLMPT